MGPESAQVGGECWGFLIGAQVAPELAREGGGAPAGFLREGEMGAARVSPVSRPPSPLQGTLIQHLKEHVLHGNMTSSDILLYYTTVCPAAPPGLCGTRDGRPCSRYLPRGLERHGTLPLAPSWSWELGCSCPVWGGSRRTQQGFLGGIPYWLVSFWSVPRTEPRSSSTLGKRSTTEPHP